MTEPKASVIQEAAGEQLGLRSWDRPAVFRDSADAATDNGLAYWLVLTLSGAIATLGLALDSSAVVIGAMLVAPLLAPVGGLALSLAVGDGRLAVQAGAVVAGSTVAVVVVGALLTILLPFQTITVEIASRTRPTTLDLAIAIFSGLVGAVVTVARGSRLSTAIPGVAISVALIPPLAVAGFGIGTGLNVEIIRGSLLLYGANLAGIVLSGMAVYLVVGMHRQDVVEAARAWRDQLEPHGLAAWVDQTRWVRSLGVFSSARGRIGLVSVFVVALGLPLSESLAQIARETRVERAVDEVGSALFAAEGHASILNRQVVYGTERAQVYLRVATTEWMGQDAREEFERRASALAKEPIRLTLEQIPTRGEDMAALTSLLGAERPRAETAAPPLPAALPDLLGTASERLRAGMRTLALPDDVYLVRAEVGTTTTGRAVLRVTYAAQEPLPAPAEAMLRRQVASALELPDAEVQLAFFSAAPYPLTGEPADSLVLREVMGILRLGDELAVEVVTEAGGDTVAARATAWLAARGLDPPRIRPAITESGGTALRIVPERVR